MGLSMSKSNLLEYEAIVIFLIKEKELELKILTNVTFRSHQYSIKELKKDTMMHQKTIQNLRAILFNLQKPKLC